MGVQIKHQSIRCPLDHTGEVLLHYDLSAIVDVSPPNQSSLYVQVLAAESSYLACFWAQSAYKHAKCLLIIFFQPNRILNSRGKPMKPTAKARCKPWIFMLTSAHETYTDMQYGTRYNEGPVSFRCRRVMIIFCTMDETEMYIGKCALQFQSISQ